jgi:hypothetical protein
MPPNEPCPVYRAVVPDWHREWHTAADQQKLFKGTAGMECPWCRAIAMHFQWQVPLIPPATGVQVETVKRDVLQPAGWAASQNGMSLADYLKTIEGKPYAGFWTAVEVQLADQKAAATNP